MVPRDSVCSLRRSPRQTASAARRGRQSLLTHHAPQIHLSSYKPFGLFLEAQVIYMLMTGRGLGGPHGRTLARGGLPWFTAHRVQAGPWHSLGWPWGGLWWHSGGLGVALGWPWSGMGRPWGSLAVALGWNWGVLGVSLEWPCGGLVVVLGWPWGGFGVTVRGASMGHPEAGATRGGGLACLQGLWLSSHWTPVHPALGCPWPESCAEASRLGVRGGSVIHMSPRIETKQTK